MNDVSMADESDLYIPDFEPSPKLYPFESRWFEARVGPIHWIQRGRGQPIVFLHGNPTWSFLYRNVIRRLGSRFRCIALDFPGFGLSCRPTSFHYTPQEQVEVLLDFLNALDLDSAVIVGHDWGGPIGMGVAVKQTDRIQKCVFTNTWCWPVETFRLRVFSWFMSTKPFRWAIVQKNLLIDQLMQMATQQNLSREVLDHYRGVQPTPEHRPALAVAPAQLRKAESWLELLERDARKRLADTPVLVAWGTKDPALPAGRFLPKWQSVLPGVEIAELDRAGHFTAEDSPRELSRVIASFASD